MSASPVRLALHGGCGNIAPETLGADREKAVRGALGDIAAEALAMLRSGAAALDAVEHAVALLEDSPYFNAGHGSVLNADGRVEADAAIMDGSDGRCGAVAVVRGIRNPVRLARLVMDRSEHVMLAGEGAERFARAQGMEPVSGETLVLPERREQFERARAGGRVSLDNDEYYGTVGAVARDENERLAAATSTGGMTNKHPGRIGDTPVIGAGTYANDATCAVSGTGHGEYYLRTVFAHAVHARMQLAGAPLDAACRAALADVSKLGGSGGVIAVDRDGHLALPFTTPGMYRALVGADGEPRVAIFPGD